MNGGKHRAVGSLTIDAPVPETQPLIGYGQGCWIVGPWGRVGSVG